MLTCLWFINMYVCVLGYEPQGGKSEAGVACGNARETSSAGKWKYDGIFPSLSVITQDTIKSLVKIEAIIIIMRQNSRYKYY